MKKARTKLTLHRETIGNLTDDRLSEAAGGATGSPSRCLTCLTNCNCPSLIETGCCQNTNLGCVQTYRC